MTKTSKSERKYGKNVDEAAPKKRGRKVKDVVEEDMYKILIDNSAFSKAMTYDDCIKTMDEMEASAKRLRRHPPSLMLVKQ